MQSAMILCRFVHFALVLSLFGCGLFRPLLLGSAPDATLDRRLLVLKRWMALLALLSAKAWLLLATAGMTGNWADAFASDTVLLVLGSTFFGQVWSWHLGFALMLLIALLLKARPGISLLLSFLLLGSLAPVGHGAMLDGVAGQLLMLNQLLHLTFVGAWIGGLLLLALLLSAPAAPALGKTLQRFSQLGYGLVAGILLTGLINTRVLTGEFWPTPLFEGFALILLIKVALVALMLMLALFNLLMSRRGHFAILRTSVTVEWLLGLGAIAAVSLLGTLPPMPTH